MRTLKKRLIKPLGWLYITLFVAVFVWMLVYDFSNTIIKIGVWAVLLAALFAVSYVFIRLRQRFVVWRERREMTRLLDGRSLDELLEKSPYAYDYEQGSDWPLIFLKSGCGTPERSTLVTSPHEARMWIVRQFIASETERID